ncbi:MAG: nitroreductase family protein [Candidatus Micrarchaeota archaeon]
MEFLELVDKRKSVRGYSSKEVEEETLLYVLECARLAPSAENKQVARFVVVRGCELRERLVKACPFFNSFLSTAPIIIAACSAGASTKHNEQDYYLVDVAIAMEHLMLGAAEKGLGSCWIAAFDESKVKGILGIPKEVRVVALTPLGYPAEEKLTQKTMGFIAKLRKRKRLEEIAFNNKWEG